MNYTTLSIQCSNCGKTKAVKPEPYKLFKKGYRATGVPYCSECVKTWAERNGEVFDEVYNEPEHLFVNWLVDELVGEIDRRQEIIEMYAQE